MFSCDLQVKLKRGDRLWRCLLVDDEIHLREFVVTSIRKMPEGYKKASLVEVVYGVTCEEHNGKLSVKKSVPEEYKSYIEGEEDGEPLFSTRYTEFAASDVEAMIDCLQIHLSEKERLFGDGRRCEMDIEEGEYYPEADKKEEEWMWAVSVIRRLLKSIKNRMHGRHIKAVYNRGTREFPF